MIEMAQGMCSSYNGDFTPTVDWPSGPYIGNGYVTSGGIVQAVQMMVQAYGCSVGSSGEDGYYGPGTQSGIECYQKLKGLSVDGIVGPQTWTALAQDLGTPSGGGAEFNYTWQPSTPLPHPVVQFNQYTDISSPNVACGYGGGEWAYVNPSGQLYWMESTFTSAALA